MLCFCLKGATTHAPLYSSPKNKRTHDCRNSKLNTANLGRYDITSVFLLKQSSSTGFIYQASKTPLVSEFSLILKKQGWLF